MHEVPLAIMVSIFCGEVQYLVQDPEPKEQLSSDPVHKIEQYTEQNTPQETDLEEPLGTEPATKCINFIIKWETEPLL